jgi:hypothetical protein
MVRTGHAQLRSGRGASVSRPTLAVAIRQASRTGHPTGRAPLSPWRFLTVWNPVVPRESRGRFPETFSEASGLCCRGVTRSACVQQGRAHRLDAQPAIAGLEGVRRSVQQRSRGDERGLLGQGRTPELRTAGSVHLLRRAGRGIAAAARRARPGAGLSVGDRAADIGERDQRCGQPSSLTTGIAGHCEVLAEFPGSSRKLSGLSSGSRRDLGDETSG